ncbi:MAG: CARDB domain-containing protein, partial [Patescibacteria group bacterium]
MAKIKTAPWPDQNRYVAEFTGSATGGTPPYRYVWIIGDSRAFSSSNTYIKWDYTITGNERLIVTDDNERDSEPVACSKPPYDLSVKSLKVVGNLQVGKPHTFKAEVENLGADYPSAFANRFWVNGNSNADGWQFSNSHTGNFQSRDMISLKSNEMTSVSGDSKYITSSKQWIPPTKGIYYLRFFTNEGNAHGEFNEFDNTKLVTFTVTDAPIVSIPTVTTKEVADIAQTTAKSGGTIVSNGGETITVSGIVWNLWGAGTIPTTGAPTLSTKTTDGWAVGGPWTSIMTNLIPNTNYRVRAYATNSAGTGYGPEITFTTSQSTYMSGTLTPDFASCVIKRNGSSCNINLTWRVTKPESLISAITANGMDRKSYLYQYSGTDPFPVPYNNRTFYLYNNSKELAQTTVTSSCEDGTSWDASERKCLSIAKICVGGNPCISSQNNCGETNNGVYQCDADGNRSCSASTPPNRSTCENTTGTCSDGIKNGNETGIDTGGRCGTVGTGTCSDGIKNGNETGIDTGGRCDIGTGTCSDGIKNGNETGIDTGGRCGTVGTGTCSDG